jgi:hypothetical protein
MSTSEDRTLYNATTEERNRVRCQTCGSEWASHPGDTICYRHKPKVECVPTFWIAEKKLGPAEPPDICPDGLVDIPFDDPLPTPADVEQRREMAQLFAENVRLSEEWERMRAEVAGLKVANVRLTREAEALRESEAAQLRSEVDAAVAIFDSIYEAVTSVCGPLPGCGSPLEAVKTLEARYRDCLERMVSATKDACELKKENQVLTVERDGLLAQLAETKETNERLGIERNSVVGQLNEANEKIGEWMMEHAGTANRLNQRNDENKQLRADLAELAAAVQRFAVEMREKDERIDGLVTLNKRFNLDSQEGWERAKRENTALLRLAQACAYRSSLSGDGMGEQWRIGSPTGCGTGSVFGSQAEAVAKILEMVSDPPLKGVGL